MADAPKLSTVTLRAGTRYKVELPDGTLSGERVLDENTEVDLIVGGPTFDVYGTKDGETWLVDINHEVR